MELTEEEIADLKKAQGIEDEPKEEEKPKKSFKDALLNENGRIKTKGPRIESVGIHKDLSKFQIDAHPGAQRKGYDKRDQETEVIKIKGSKTTLKVVTTGKFHRGYSPPRQSQSSATKKNKWRNKREEDRKVKESLQN